MNIKKAKEINKGFLKRIKTGLPLISLKLVVSINGKIAMSSGESKCITSYKARQQVQCFRAGTKIGNKQIESALTLLEMINILRKLSKCEFNDEQL